LLAGCSSGNKSASGGAYSAAKGCKKIGVSLPESDTSARWEGVDHPDLQSAITKALPGASIDFANAQNSSDTQISQTDSFLTKGDCILVVAPQDAQKSATIVQNAKNDKVPVIAYDRLIQSNDLQYYVSFDNTKVGQLQGQYIADHYQTFVTADGNNNMIMIDGSQDDNNALLFKAGAHSVLDSLTSANSLTLKYETFTPAWNNNTAQTEMEGALTQVNNKVAVAYVANDGMAGTVIAALQAQGLAGKVLVTGQDATAAGIQQILLGNQSMTVYKAIQKEADATAAIVAALSNGASTTSITNGATIKLASGNSVPAVLEVPVAVDKSNIATTVLADGYVKKADICQGVPAGTDGIC
ncbi:MAG: sugar ABC transporter substrate-binding protein, partial [Ktedonobacterales bacterium]